MDLLAEIEALQAELDNAPAPTTDDAKKLDVEVKKTQAAASAAKGTRKKKAEPEPVVQQEIELDDVLESVEPAPEPVKKKKPAKAKVDVVEVTTKAPVVKIELLPKKVKEKALNAIKALEVGAELSRYTRIALKRLSEGACTRSELVELYVEAGLGASTANSQATQMRSLFPALGLAEVDTDSIRPIKSSPFFALLR